MSRTAPLVLTLCLAPFAVLGQEVRLKLHHMLPPVAPGHARMLVPWADRLEADSGGRLVIDIYPLMHLGGQAPALIDQARLGIVDVIWTLPGYTPGRFPRIEVFELPFLTAHPVIMNLAIHDFLQNHREEFADYHLISAFVHAGQVIHSQVPIRTTAELAGLKFRIPTRVAAWMVEAWGGIPIGTTVQKIPEMLSKGIVDAALIPYEASFGLKVHDMVDHHILLDDPASPRFNSQVLVLVMNRDSYAALPADLKAVLDANSGRNIARWMGEVWTENEEVGESAAAASGELIYLPRAEVALLRESIRDEVAERWISVVEKDGIDGRALVEEATMLLDHYARVLRERGTL
jgi:TRAP-type C4-dicarboxylate transport system substrate-binding protein